MHLGIILSHLAPLSSRPHHKRIHRPFHVGILGAHRDLSPDDRASIAPAHFTGLRYLFVLAADVEEGDGIFILRGCRMDDSEDRIFSLKSVKKYFLLSLIQLLFLL